VAAPPELNAPLPGEALGWSRLGPVPVLEAEPATEAAHDPGVVASTAQDEFWRPSVQVGEAEGVVATVCAGGPGSLRWADAGAGADPVAWRARVRAYVQCVLGLDGHTAAPVALEIDGFMRLDGRVTRLALRYRSSPDGSPDAGHQIPAFLFVPDASRPVPAVVVYHGHGSGKVNVAEREGSPENALGLRIALDLGYVVLAPDARSFGAASTGPHATYWQALPGTPHDNYMTRLARDGYQDMAVLRGMPSVDPGHIGVAGLSLGAWRALLLGLLQRDVSAVVSTGLYIPFGYLFSQGHDGCQHLPALADRLDMEDLGAALAPAGFLVQWGQRDWFYGVNDAEGLLQRTLRIAEAQGVAEGIVRDVHPTVGHQFVVQPIEDFLRARLGPGAWE